MIFSCKIKLSKKKKGSREHYHQLRLLNNCTSYTLDSRHNEFLLSNELIIDRYNICVSLLSYILRIGFIAITKKNDSLLRFGRAGMVTFYYNLRAC